MCVRVYVRVYVRVCACVAGYAGETRPLPRNPKSMTEFLNLNHRVEDDDEDTARKERTRPKLSPQRYTSHSRAVS